MRAAIGLAVIAVVAAGGLGRARADEDPREVARKEFAAGQDADRRKDWKGAIEHYMRANDRMAHPFAIYNIAVDYERLDKLREAATWYERYLAATTDAAERERVQRILEELIARPAPFEVRTTPERARVFVDAIPVGTTPYRETLKGGFHRITVELGGRREHRDVTVEYAEPVTLELALGEVTGTVLVTGAPRGAAIHVDDRAAGALPAQLTLPAGAHPMRIESPGYAPYETTVTITPDRPAKVNAQLARLPGTEAGAGEGNSTAPGNTPGGAPGTAPRPIRAGYLFGFAGGADARGSGGIGLLEFSARLGPFDGGVRIGRAAQLTNVDLLARWALLPGRLTPFLGAAYTFVQGGGGYTLTGGLRWDVARGDRGGVSVLAESGLRYYRAEVSPSGGATVTTTGFIVPVMASVLVQYK